MKQMRSWMKWLAVGMDVVLGLYVAAIVALMTFLPTFHDCTCFGGPTPLERFGNAVEDVVSCIPLQFCMLVWLNVRAYWCLRTCSLRRWWRILAGLVLWPAALGILFLTGCGIYNCIKDYYCPPSWVKEPTFKWIPFLIILGHITTTGIVIVIGEKMGLFKRNTSERKS